MAWDFSTEPEFQEQLDWVEEVRRAEVERLVDLVFPGAAYRRIPGEGPRRPAEAAGEGQLPRRCSSTRTWAAWVLGAEAGPDQRDPGPLPATAGARFVTAAPDTGNMDTLGPATGR